MILLNVPFAEKEQAKSLGARWNPVEKKWYIPDDLSDNTDPFQKWLPVQRALIPSPDQSVPNPSQNFIAPFSNQSCASNDPEKGIELSQLMYKVQGALKGNFPGAVWVKAEIINLNERRGHYYFELAENTESGQQLANCRGMIWQRQAEAILLRFQTATGAELAAGQKILMLVEVNFHEKFGFSLTIKDIDPSYTLGESEAKLNQIRKQLVTEKLYDRNKVFKMPKDFYRVAVIAPPEAAGLGDFRADADELVAFGLCDFHYFYSSFQSEKTEQELLAAMEALLSLHEAQAFDALVMIRGGGAKLDFNPLNTYLLAKKIAEMPLPVLTGIGHERDNTILDEVSAVRFDTPSKVIAGIRQSIVSQAQKADSDWHWIEKTSREYISEQKLKLDRFEKDVQQVSQSLVHQQNIKLTSMLQTIHHQSRIQLEQQQGRIANIQQTLFNHADRHCVYQSNRLAQLNATYRDAAGKQVLRHKIELSNQWERVKDQPDMILQQQTKQIKQWIGFVLSSGPKSQLERGFAMLKRDSQPIKTLEALKQSSHFTVVLADGSVEAKLLDQKKLN